MKKDKVSPLFLTFVSDPVGVEMRSNCDNFISEAMLTPSPCPVIGQVLKNVKRKLQQICDRTLCNFLS